MAHTTGALSGPQRRVIRRAVAWYLRLQAGFSTAMQVRLAESVKQLLDAEPAWVENIEDKHIKYK